MTKMRLRLHTSDLTVPHLTSCTASHDSTHSRHHDNDIHALTMLLTLLLITQAAAEWVEISQQHYRKPVRTHSSYNPFTTPDKFEVEDTTKTWIYNNKSVTEQNWIKAPRQPNTGNIKRVQYPSSSVKPTESVRIVEEYSDVDEDEFEVRTQVPSKASIDFSDDVKQKATITRVPNVGNVRRVQLSNTPVKSPFLNNDDRDKVAKTRYEELPLENEKEEAVLFEHKRRSDSKTNNRRIYVNEIKKQHSTEATSTFPIDDEPFTEEVIRKRPKPESKNHTNMKNIPPPKPTFITETEDFTQDDKYENKFYKVTQSTVPRVTEKKHIFTTTPTNIDEDVTEKYEETPKEPPKQNYKTNDLVKHRPVNNIPEIDIDNGGENTADNEPEIFINKKDNRPVFEQEYIPAKENNANRKNEQSAGKKKIPSEENKPDNKVNNMENLMKLMKVVADTISQNSRRSFGGKMRYLHELKDTILANIAERIDSVWPDDAGPHRRSRAAHASARGHHVHFPSSESALMTISFLTFAVFLIKLVLQVIHTYKNKAMMVAPVMVAAAGRAALAHRGNH